MDCINVAPGKWEITFAPSVCVDKVHAEAICALLRTMHTHASHFTDYSTLKLRVKHPSLESAEQVKALIREAASLRAAQLRALI
jgi:hypothetical protein